MDCELCDTRYGRKAEAGKHVVMLAGEYIHVCDYHKGDVVTCASCGDGVLRAAARVERDGQNVKFFCPVDCGE